MTTRRPTCEIREFLYLADTFHVRTMLRGARLHCNNNDKNQTKWLILQFVWLSYCTLSAIKGTGVHVNSQEDKRNVIDHYAT